MLLALLLSFTTGVPQTYIGVLQTEHHERRLRVLFTATAGKWRGTGDSHLVHGGDQPTWEVLLDGMQVGKVTAGEGQFEQKLPERVETKLSEFKVGDADRAILLVRGPKRAKPLKPAASVAGDDAMSKAYEAFRAHAKKYKFCQAGGDRNPVSFADDDMQVVSALRLHGGEVVAVAPRESYNLCTSPPGPGLPPSVYAIAGKAVSLGEGTRLIEAGDFDGNGTEEYVFWVEHDWSSSVSKTYVLYADDFAYHVDYKLDR